MLSPLVGLVLIRPIDPVFPSPPINSLVPLRCPAALEGIDLSLSGDSGESGGLAYADSPTNDVVELNEKLGSSAGIDIGRRDVAFGMGAGAEAGALAGNTNAGS